MAERDLYEVLGVEREADDGAIKKAYRRLAMELHPDRNPDDESAAERFKEVNAAYDILKDPQKRAAYDRFGSAAFGGGGRGGPGGPHAGADFGAAFTDMFEELFGGAMGGRRGARGSNRGSDIRYEIAIDLEEAYAGKKVRVRVPSLVACDACKQTGSSSGKEPAACRHCNGTGVLRTQQSIMTFERTCPHCRGVGKMISDPCRHCRGAGRMESKRDVDVTIPPGMDDGHQLKVRGEGEAGIRGGPPGDLFIVVRVRRHRKFERSRADLRTSLQVPFTTAVLGGEMRAPTLDGGWTQVTVPEGTQPGQQLRLRGKGMPRVNTSGHGDLYLTVHLQTPTRLTRRQRKLMEEFAEEERKRG